MIEIKNLLDFQPEEIRSLARGYRSSAKYQVSKTESDRETMIKISLVALDQPYVKEWPLIAEDLERYRQAALQGFSLGAFEDGKMVGVVIAEPRLWNQSLWVWELSVEEAHQRQGIGALLLDALADLAAKNKLRVLVCETQSTNVPAINFYRKAGFELDGIDLSYYTNHDVPDGETAIFMKRKIA